MTGNSPKINLRGVRSSAIALFVVSALALGACGSIGKKSKTASEPVLNGSCDVSDDGTHSYCIEYYGYADDQIKAELADPCAALTVSTMTSSWSANSCSPEARVVGCKVASEDPGTPAVSATIWYYEPEAASKVADSCKIMP